MKISTLYLIDYLQVNPIVPAVNIWPVGIVWHMGSPNIILM